jgi:hypothetical protein
MNNIFKNKPWFKDILCKSELSNILIRNLYEYYLTNDRIDKILPIITSNSHISIRVLDWFVTNYSKKYNIIYELSDVDNSDRYFNVFLQYKCQLKAYKKKKFDPFCRKQKLLFYYDINKCVETTLGQLNFFRWALNNEILTYVENNLQKIINDINKNQNKLAINSLDKIDNLNTLSEIKYYDDIIDNSIVISKYNSLNSSESDKRKRHELSKNANKSLNIHNYSIILSFD